MSPLRRGGVHIVSRFGVFKRTIVLPSMHTPCAECGRCGHDRAPGFLCMRRSHIWKVGDAVWSLRPRQGSWLSLRATEHAACVRVWGSRESRRRRCRSSLVATPLFAVHTLAAAPLLVGGDAASRWRLVGLTLAATPLFTASRQQGCNYEQHSRAHCWLETGGVAACVVFRYASLTGGLAALHFMGLFSLQTSAAWPLQSQSHLAAFAPKVGGEAASHSALGLHRRYPPFVFLWVGWRRRRLGCRRRCNLHRRLAARVIRHSRRPFPLARAQACDHMAIGRRYRLADDIARDMQRTSWTFRHDWHDRIYRLYSRRTPIGWAQQHPCDGGSATLVRLIVTPQPHRFELDFALFASSSNRWVTTTPKRWRLSR